MEFDADSLTQLARENAFTGAVRVDAVGGVVFEAAFGLADRAHGLPNTVDTRFGTASASKAFTALVVLSLVSDGVLDLDEPVRARLPDLPQLDADVTVRRLLSHTSGVGEYLDDDADADTYVLPGSMHGYLSPEDFVPLLDLPMRARPGNRFEYSNAGFVLLGLSFGQSSGSVASSFSPAYRYTGSAITSDLAWLFGAGFAPLAALVLSTRFGLISAGAYLLSGAVCTLLALYFNRQWEARRAGPR